MVRPEARVVAPLQVAEGEEQPLDRNHHPQHLRVDREAQQEGRILFQTVSSHGSISLGEQRSRGKCQMKRQFKMPNQINLGI